MVKSLQSISGKPPLFSHAGGCASIVVMRAKQSMSCYNYDFEELTKTCFYQAENNSKSRFEEVVKMLF